MDFDEMRGAVERATAGDVVIHSDPEGRYVLWQADCRTVLSRMRDNTVDAIVTDPPYELGFMGKSWDASGIAYDTDLWRECLRVLKPGGHLLAFGGTRTYHRMACAIEDAGFTAKDSVAWVYGQGFPKSLDVSKAIDKMNGEPDRLHKFTAWMRTTGLTARQIDKLTNTNMGGHYLTAKSQPAIPTSALWKVLRPYCGDVPEWVDQLVARIEAEREVLGTAKTTMLAVAPGQGTERPQTELPITAPATDAAKQWDGWGTALKPAMELVMVARKPLEGTVAANVLKWGTGAFNIDGTRVASDDPFGGGAKATSGFVNGYQHDGWQAGSELGRWPANFIHDGSDEVLALFPETAGGARPAKANKRTGAHYEGGWGTIEEGPRIEFDAGSAARFFYCAKAGKKERNAGLEHLDEREAGVKNESGRGFSESDPHRKIMRQNHHPTVKPIALMRYLIRLVTPPGGVVLDPFAGSGTTMVAALMEGAQPWGCEMTAEYVPIILGRVGWALDEVESRIEGTL